MNKFQSLILSLCLLAPACVAAQSTTKLTASKANEYGLIYTLPVTALDVTVAAEKTVKTPGEFYQYAKKYLGVDPILTPSTSWRITEAVVTPTAIPDESARYLVTLKGGNGVSVMVNDRNFPLSINDESYAPAVAAAALPQPVEAVPTILETPVARQAVTPEMIQSRSSAKKAELAAAKIYELRTQRNEIISGQADGMPKDGEAMKLALDQISAQEAALTAMFLGTEQTSVDVATFRVAIPEDGAETRVIVARLSAVGGIVDAGDLSGAPIYLNFKPVTRGKLPVNEKGQVKTFPKGGVAYRIPGTADVSLNFDGDVIFKNTFDITQLGVVFGLDPSLFTSKKSPSYLHFSPLTGAIRELGTITE